MAEHEVPSVGRRPLTLAQICEVDASTRDSWCVVPTCGGSYQKIDLTSSTDAIRPTLMGSQVEPGQATRGANRTKIEYWPSVLGASQVSH